MSLKFNSKNGHQQGLFSKIRALSSIFKKWQGRPPPPPVVAHLWVWLNIHQYPWISLNIPENAWINCPVMLGLWICLIILRVPRAFENAWCSKYSRVLNMGYICKGYTELWMWLSIAHCVSIMSKYASICLSVLQCPWKWLDIVPEYAWKCLNKLFWLWQGSQYASLS